MGKSDLLIKLHFSLLYNHLNINFINFILFFLICPQETKAQNFLLAIIVAAIFNFVIGSVIGPSTPQQQAEGFIGFNRKIELSLGET